MSSDDLDPYAEAYRAARVIDDLPPMTAGQELAVWKQAFREQCMRADSNLRAWAVAMVLLFFTNMTWVVCTSWK